MNEHGVRQVSRTDPRKPTPADLAAARGKAVRDLIGPNLRVLFCGINPSLYSAATGHHFARPGNRFWPTLFAAGFTTRRLVAHEGAELLSSGYGVTNLVRRATAAASELSDDEYVHGGQRLARKVRQYRPRFLAILGVGAYRAAWGRPGAQLGPQAERLGGTAIWVLPNPSGLNAHYQIDDLAKLYRQLRQACEVA